MDISGIPYYVELPVIHQPIVDPAPRPIQAQPPPDPLAEAAPQNQNPFFVISRLAIIVMLLSQHGSYSRMITLLCIAFVIALAELGYLSFLRRYFHRQTPATENEPNHQIQENQGFWSFFISTAYSFITSLIPT